MDRVQEMRRMRFEESKTLQEIADRYGISRERVRQILGNSGQVALGKKRRTYNENKHLSNSILSGLLGIVKRSIYNYRNGERHEIDGGYAKIGADTEVVVSKKLFSLGIGNKLMPHMHTFDILLDNGIKIDVKSSNPMPMSRLSPMYNFATGVYRKGHYCDFLILFLQDAKEFFVVPDREITGIIRFCWPESDYGKKSKWLDYHNRFDLLKG
jgi:hypothetical protein